LDRAVAVEVALAVGKIAFEEGVEGVQLFAVCNWISLLRDSAWGMEAMLV